jgi:hypothetical protein
MREETSVAILCNTPDLFESLLSPASAAMFAKATLGILAMKDRCVAFALFWLCLFLSED